MKLSDVAVQIVNYKTKKFLEPLIESIVHDIAGSGLTVEINILDNASGDDLQAIAKKWQGHNLHLYQADANRGFGAGHNLLAGKTSARYLLILNPDLIFIEQQTIARLVERLVSSRATVVGPRLLTPRSRADISLAQLAGDQLKQQPWDHCKRSIGPYRPHNELISVAWVSGAALLVDSQQFLAVHGFDEKFFLYYEEVDLCLRLRKRGHRVIYDPDIQLLHYGNAVARKASVYMLKSLLYFQLKRLRLA